MAFCWATGRSDLSHRSDHTNSLMAWYQGKLGNKLAIMYVLDMLASTHEGERHGGRIPNLPKKKKTKKKTISCEHSSLWPQKIQTGSADTTCLDLDEDIIVPHFREWDRDNGPVLRLLIPIFRIGGDVSNAAVIAMAATQQWYLSAFISLGKPVMTNKIEKRNIKNFHASGLHKKRTHLATRPHKLQDRFGGRNAISF
jgi:hypothetical protein